MAMDMNARKKALGRLLLDRSQAVPALGAFVEDAEALLSTSSEGDLEHDAQFWRCSDVFDTFTKTDFVKRLLNHELQKFISDEIYVPLMSFSSQIVIAETDYFQLNLGLVNRRTARPNGRLQSLASHCMLHVHSGSLPIAQYLQPEPFPAERFDRDKRLTDTGIKVYERGDHFYVRAGYDIIDFRPSERHTSVIVNLSSTKFISYAWEYDRETLSPIRFVPGDMNWSRVDYAIQIMAAAQDANCLDMIVTLAEHPAHFVRWSAIRAAVQLDGDVGLRLLETATEDAHPSVRKAAQQTLDRFHATPA